MMSIRSGTAVMYVDVTTPASSRSTSVGIVGNVAWCGEMGKEEGRLMLAD
jgi:hypothetical protein